MVRSAELRPRPDLVSTRRPDHAATPRSDLPNRPRSVHPSLDTTSDHLARALVEVGDVAERGQPIALSGYSGIDALVAFPWSVPHVHFNVWLDGDYVDPFAAEGETPLWLDGNDARPAPDTPDAPTVIADPPLEPTTWDPDLVAAAIDACTDEDCRQTLLRQPDLARRAMDVFFLANYYPTRFRQRPSLYRDRHPRAPWLTLPFRPADCTDITFAEPTTEPAPRRPRGAGRARFLPDLSHGRCLLHSGRKVSAAPTPPANVILARRGTVCDPQSC